MEAQDAHAQHSHEQRQQRPPAAPTGGSLPPRAHAVGGVFLETRQRPSHRVHFLHVLLVLMQEFLRIRSKTHWKNKKTKSYINSSSALHPPDLVSLHLETPLDLFPAAHITLIPLSSTSHTSIQYNPDPTLQCSDSPPGSRTRTSQLKPHRPNLTVQTSLSTARSTTHTQPKNLTRSLVT